MPDLVNNKLELVILHFTYDTYYMRDYMSLICEDQLRESYREKIPVTHVRLNFRLIKWLCEFGVLKIDKIDLLDAIGSLIKNNYLETDENNIFRVRLTEKGFNLVNKSYLKFEN